MINNYINNYLEQLYFYLGDQFCFLSGAFVIEDTDDKLLKVLMNTKPQEFTYNIIQSHTTYFQGKKSKTNNNKQFYYDDQSGFTRTTNMYGFYETTLKIPHNIDCKCSNKTSNETSNKKQIKSMKWYKFEQNNKSFIFLKLEDNPTQSIPHLFDAVKRYGLKKPNVSCRIPRREDCNKEKNCQFTDTDPDKIQPGQNYDKIEYNIYGSPVVMTDAIVPNAYHRKGDEVFIPSIINDYILKNASNASNASNAINADVLQLFEVKGNTIKLTRPIKDPTQSIQNQNNSMGGKKIRKRTRKNGKNKGSKNKRSKIKGSNKSARKRK